MSKYPEADKVSEHKQDMQVIGDFLTWLFSNRLTLCRWQEKTYYDEEGNQISHKEIKERNLSWFYSEYHIEDEGFYPVNYNINDLLAEYFNIDMDKYEEEKRQMLENLQTRTYTVTEIK